MGAKAPPKERIRHFKCDVCGASFTSVPELWTHKRNIHMHKKDPSRRIALKKQQKGVPNTDKVGNIGNNKEKKLKFVLKDSKPEVPKVDEKMAKKIVRESLEKENGTTKTQFKCPVCSMVFPAYFLAYKHMQKEHPINSKGEEVPPNSSEMIRPLKIEVCELCSKVVDAIPHSCEDESDEETGDNCICPGCDNRSFPNLYLFETHIMQFHSNNVESFFFPNKEEFANWQNVMETQTRCKYVKLTNNRKYILGCTMLKKHSTKGAGKYCPSSIIVQEYPGGIQVNLYKDHYGHNARNYTVNDYFKKFLTTSYIKNNSEPTADGEPDLYLQFKSLMESIILNSAKINVNSLKILVGKALEMTSVLNSYDEDAESDKALSSSLKLKTDKKMSEDQITEALNSMTQKNTDTKKRKSVDEKDLVVSKKRRVTRSEKDEVNSPKIVNCYSLAELSGKEVKEEEKKVNLASIESELTGLDTSIASPKPTPKPVVTASPSFHDSYQNFIGSFSQKDSKGDKKTEKRKVENLSIERNIKEDKKPKKQIVKTKMGQFKPSLSPRKREVPVEPIVEKPKDNIVAKGKVDFEYEVKEQENDCNILILKI